MVPGAGIVSPAPAPGEQMADLTSWCRGCDSLCGLLADTELGRLVSVRGDPEHPVSSGRDCAFGNDAAWRIGREDRLLLPTPGRSSTPQDHLGWETALADVTGRLATVIEQRGERGVGVLLGGAAARSQRLTWALEELQRSVGPIQLFSHAAGNTAPLLQASRQLLGRATSMRADLARTRHVLLLGGNQLAEGSAPGHAGHALVHRIDAGAQRADLHLTVADARGTALTRRAHAHLPIRPGTELYLVLGICSAMLRSEWWDRHDVAERTLGFEALRAALEPWTVARSAELCGIGRADITAEALRFSRASTAVVHAGVQAWGTPWSTLTAWATMVLQALTSNLLAPGGLYAHPATSNLDSGLVAHPASDLPSAIRAGLGALVCIEADPLTELADPDGLAQLLEGLDCLVCLDRSPHDTARMAHWALPGTHYLEQSELGFADACDRHWVQWTSGLVVPPGECRTYEAVVRDLAVRVGGTRCAGPGRGVLAGLARPSRAPSARERRVLAASARDLGIPLPRLLAAASPGLSRTADRQRGLDAGSVDRATWSVTHPHGRIELASRAMVQALAAHVPALPGATYPLWLMTSARRDPARGPWERRDGSRETTVALHPDLGHAEGRQVRISTAHGSVIACVQPDLRLRPDTVDLPVGQPGHPLALVDSTHRDRWSGTCWTDGQPCRVEPVS